MKALRLSEVLLPMLAARGWAPWLIEPRRAKGQRAQQRPRVVAASRAAWREREQRRLPFDDVQ
jgi:hypothetical protein